MTILLIAEARSGSTNLAKWLKQSLPGYKLFNEPFNYRSSHYVGKNNKIDYNENIIISEKYFYNEELINEYLKNSDKVFCLTRENKVEQMESYIMALKTENWYSKYIPKNIYDNIENFGFRELERFHQSRIDFKNFIDTNNLKTFTYENLYFNNGIDELKTYLNIESDISFPYGERYRQFDIKKSIV